jgi:hypothetical protein
MRNMIRVLALLSLSVSALSACGPATEDTLSPPAGEAARVEQEIGSSPSCPIGGYRQDSVTWGATCKACSEVGGDGTWTNGAYGRPGTLYQRCCDQNGACGSWKLIRPVCTQC